MDAHESRKSNWEDLEVTKEELKNLNECLKKEDFRKLLIEYADEVNDPKNRKIYEDEITQLEKERGVDVTFVNPEPGYVIKTSVNGDKKCFLNVSKSNIVERPTSQPSFEQGHRGLQWSIPYTLIPPRDDLDKKNVRCMVFDVVFHPDTIYLTSKNARFREIVNNTAMDGVEKHFQVKLDRKNIKFPKMSYKGICHPTVIRKESSQPPEKQLDMEPEIYQKLITSYDQCREQRSRRTEEKAKRPPPPSVYYKDSQEKQISANADYVVPKFSIKHQTDVELEDFGTAKDAKMYATMPKRIIVTVDLPLLSSATDASLDVQERMLNVKSEKPAKYFLELPLPYRVDADSGCAKFDPKYKKLTVTLPVIRSSVFVQDTREDSGVDSDHGSPVPQISDNSIVMPNSSNTDDCNVSLPHLVEECENMLATTELSEESERIDQCADTALRTKTAKHNMFRKHGFEYTLPPFTCNVYDNQLAITVNVKNVDPSSIEHRMLDNNLGVHIVLVSIGAGFFPQNYSLCLKIKEGTIDPESITTDPWDNNVVFTFTVKNIENVTHYYTGIDEDFMEEKDLPTAASFKDQLKRLMEMPDTDVEKSRNVESTKSSKVVKNIPTNRLDSDDEQEQHYPRPTCRQTRKYMIAKSRSVSESSGDELASSSGSVSHAKGILKSRRSHDFSRSVSESSADENAMHASSMDYQYDYMHEINSESECSSLKKTVRFNDVVSRQLFRSNSSILGQRKKNQRKLRNKKRAHERRVSESENSETDERDKYKTNHKNTSEHEMSDNVKSILNRDKQLEQQGTVNVESDKTKYENVPTADKHKSSLGNIMSHIDREGIAKNEVKAEFKNDLIFDLDM
ncbi:hypothetical protein KM043_008229 [Ampulex compressa]|nr:hypothetical protein KM043_008229 [Ampulex compressa]